MAEYLVTWSIGVEAAAREALAIQRDPTSEATVFLVEELNWPTNGGTVQRGTAVEVDL